jgi:Novel toxin 16
VGPAHAEATPETAGSSEAIELAAARAGGPSLMLGDISARGAIALQRAVGNRALRRVLARQHAPAPTAAPPLVTVDCGAMQIGFHTSAGDQTYALSSCDMTPGDYTARVSVTGHDLTLDFGTQAAEGRRFSFAYRVAPGQRDPTQLFSANNVETLVAVDNSSEEPEDEACCGSCAAGGTCEGDVGTVDSLSTQPLQSYLQPDAMYAVALTPGLVSSGGYSVPQGLLASNALAAEGAAAEGLATAESLVAAQGLTATTTAVAEGTTVAEALTAAGEGLLVMEAAGGAEVEAATGPPGWIVGAIVLVAAGGLLAAGYLLSRPRAQATTTPQATPRATPRATSNERTGDCTEERHDGLQDEVTRQCKRLPRGCTPGMGKAELKRNAMRNERCARARDRMNNECFGGGDAGHQQAARLAWEAAQRCWDLYRRADRSR